MNVTYDVEGNLKRMFTSEDTFKNLTLYKTGYTTFTKTWGNAEQLRDTAGGGMVQPGYGEL